MKRAHWLSLTRGIRAASDPRTDLITRPYKGVIKSCSYLRAESWLRLEVCWSLKLVGNWLMA